MEQKQKKREKEKKGKEREKKQKERQEYKKENKDKEKSAKITEGLVKLGPKWGGGGSSIYFKSQSILCDIFDSQSSRGVLSFAEEEIHTVLGSFYYPICLRFLGTELVSQIVCLS